MLEFINDLMKPPPTIAEKTKEGIKTLNRQIRELERTAEREDKDRRKMKKDVKKCLSNGEKIKATSLTRQMIKSENLSRNYYHMIEKIRDIRGILKSVKGNALLTKTTKSIFSMVSMMNAGIDVHELMQQMKEFDKSSMELESKQELMDDITNDMLDADGDNDDRVESMMNEMQDELLQEQFNPVDMISSKSMMSKTSRGINNNIQK